MTAVFEGPGVKIQYPKNWKLHNHPTNLKPYDITIESPAGSIWNLHVFPNSSDAQSLAREILLELEKNYDSVEFEETSEQIEQFHLSGYDANFFYLDLLIEARIRYFTTSEHTFVLLIQAEDRDFKREQLVLAAITTSFVRNLDATNL